MSRDRSLDLRALFHRQVRSVTLTFPSACRPMLPWAFFNRGFALVLLRSLLAAAPMCRSTRPDAEASVATRDERVSDHSSRGWPSWRTREMVFCVLAICRLLAVAFSRSFRRRLTRPAPTPGGASFPGDRCGRPVQRWFRGDVCVVILVRFGPKPFRALLEERSGGDRSVGSANPGRWLPKQCTFLGWGLVGQPGRGHAGCRDVPFGIQYLLAVVARFLSPGGVQVRGSRVAEATVGHHLHRILRPKPGIPVPGGSRERELRGSSPIDSTEVEWLESSCRHGTVPFLFASWATS